MNLSPLPSPPTDNLYKFMALTGLVLFFGAPIYWAVFTNSAQQRQMEAWHALLQGIADKPYEYYVRPTPPTDPAAAKAQEESREKLVRRVERDERDLFRANAALAPYQRFGWIVDAVALVFFLAGVLITWLGFTLWYVRLQRPLDAILANQIGAKRARFQPE